MKGKSVYLSAGLLWFGAAASIAEIMTGAALAPLGFARGMAANIIGHLIGCAALYFAGLIGAREDMSAMQTSQLSFGRGAGFFSLLNVAQLAGWTAVMIYTGARAAAGIVGSGFHAAWCALLGVMICVWIMAGIKNFGKLNIIAVGSLFALTLPLGYIVMRGGSFPAGSGEIGFGLAVELSAVMPLSWLPLISDYTRGASKPRLYTFYSVAAYFVGSVFMYMIGMSAALRYGTPDAISIMSQSGLGMVAMCIVILTTVTTTYLDVYSAGESANTIHSKASPKAVSMTVCIIGATLAALAPVTRYEDFLLFIGSVFAPMSAVLLTDYFLLKQRGGRIGNAVCWLAGFALYHTLNYIGTPVGSTLPTMAVVSVACLCVHHIKSASMPKASKM